MSKLRVRIFDGSRKSFSERAKFLVTIIDGNKHRLFRDYIEANEEVFSLPFFDGLGDNYTVIVWADGYKQAGFAPVYLSDEYEKTLDLMLVPDDPGFSFAAAAWEKTNATYPFLGGGGDAAAASTRYGDLMEAEKPLACLLNLCEAMSLISLAQGTPLDYLRQLRWDAPFAPAQDRFYAWCDPKLIDQVRVAAAARKFAPEKNPGTFHAGATCSWKQIEFGEANVQLTFHEKEKKTIDGLECVMVEPDIDYFRDLGAHAIFEVIPNSITHGLTNPVEVYVLRWIAGRHPGVPEFNPLYAITA